MILHFSAELRKEKRQTYVVYNVKSHLFSDF